MKRTVIVKSVRLCTCLYNKTEPNCASVKLTNLSVKKFRRMEKKKLLSSFQLYLVVTRGLVSDLRLEQNPDDSLNKLLDKLKSVFKSELPRGLPLQR